MADVITTLIDEISRDEIYPNIKTANIPDGGVITGKLADNSITTIKIIDGAITKDKLDTNTKNQLDNNTNDIEALNDKIKVYQNYVTFQINFNFITISFLSDTLIDTNLSLADLITFISNHHIKPTCSKANDIIGLASGSYIGAYTLTLPLGSDFSVGDNVVINFRHLSISNNEISLEYDGFKVNSNNFTGSSWGNKLSSINPTITQISSIPVFIEE